MRTFYAFRVLHWLTTKAKTITVTAEAEKKDYNDNPAAVSTKKIIENIATVATIITMVTATVIVAIVSISTEKEEKDYNPPTR